MASPPELDESLNRTRADRSFFGHPRGLATLFFTEMWERFSYYGMRALLILFMTASVDKGGLGFPVVKAGAVYGFYTAMVYLLSLPGGWVADRLIGQRRAVLYGGVLITAGEFFLMGVDIRMFYAGLILLMFGTGLLKANVSTIVGQIYAPGDERRDSGFSIFYMGINIGATISPLISFWLRKDIPGGGGSGCRIGMAAGVIQYLFGSKYLGSAGLYPVKPESAEAGRRQKRNAGLAAIGTIAVLGLLLVLGATGEVEFTAELISNALGVVLVLVSVGVFSWLLLAGDGPRPNGSAPERSWCSLSRRFSFGPHTNKPDLHSICSPNVTPIVTSSDSSFRPAGSNRFSR